MIYPISGIVDLAKGKNCLQCRNSYFTFTVVYRLIDGMCVCVCVSDRIVISYFNSLSPIFNCVDFRVAGLAILRCK